MRMDSKSITLLVFLISSLASLSLVPQLTVVNVNTWKNYGFLYASNVNYYSYGSTISVTTNRVVSFGATYGAFSGYCGTNEEATAWILTLDGEHRKFSLLCASTYGNERIHDSYVRDNYIYVAGSMRWIPGAQYDLNYEGLIAKLDPNGNLVWGKALGNLSTSEVFYGVTVDDHIYAVGYVSPGVNVINPTPSGILLVKIDKSNGNIIWTYVYSGNYDMISGIGIASSGGYIYVLGKAVTSQGYEKNIVMKINTNGNIIWAFETDPVYENIVAGDAIYLVGSVVTKIDSNGNMIWSKEYGAVFPSGYYHNGYIYLAGFMNNQPAITKIDTNGNIVWSKQLNYNGRAYDVAVYGSIVYVTGYIILTYRSQFVLGITEDFTNDYVTQVALTPSQTTTSKTAITLTRQSWNLTETSTMSQVEASSYSPAPIFKGSGTSVPTPTPTPTPTPSPTPTQPTEETTETQQSKPLVIIAVIFCSLLALSSIFRFPVKKHEYEY